MNLDDFSDLIERPDGGVRRDAEERRERLIVPPGALGRLDELGEWLSAAQQSVPVKAVEQPRVVLFAADHGVAELDVSGRAAGTTHELVRAALEGASPVAVLARRFAVPLRIVDAGIDCDPELLPESVVRHRVRRGPGASTSRTPSPPRRPSRQSAWAWPSPTRRPTPAPISWCSGT